MVSNVKFDAAIAVLILHIYFIRRSLKIFDLLTKLITAYYYITWRVWIHRCLDADEDKYQLKWLSVWRMPEVVTIQEAQNGTATKKHQ